MSELLLRKFIKEALEGEPPSLTRDQKQMVTSIVKLFSAKNMSSVHHGIFTLDSLGDPAVNSAVYRRLLKYFKIFDGCPRSTLTGGEKFSYKLKDEDDKALFDLMLKVFNECGVMSQVKNLYINFGDFKDINFLSEATGLERLNIINNPNLTDVSALSKMPNMRFLSLSLNTSLADISAVANLKNLQSLYLTGCTSITDISAIKDLPYLSSFSGASTSLPKRMQMSMPDRPFVRTLQQELGGKWSPV